MFIAFWIVLAITVYLLLSLKVEAKSSAIIAVFITTLLFLFDYNFIN